MAFTDGSVFIILKRMCLRGYFLITALLLRKCFTAPVPKCRDIESKIAGVEVCRFLNHEIGSGYYLVSGNSSFVHPGLIIRGRLSGLIVQNFKAISTEVGIRLDFNVPLGFKYFSFADIEYYDYKYPNSTFAALGYTVFVDEFDFPVLN